MKNEKGITLIVLVVTIILLLVITGVGVATSYSHLNSVKLKSFYTKLEMATEGIQIYKDDETIKQQGAEPTEEQASLITSLGYNSSYFRYFTAEQVNNVLEISGVDLNLLVDFTNNIVINPEGLEIDGVKYYKLENSKYSVQLDKTKISGPIDFNYTVEKYGNTKYKINVIPVNIDKIL